MNLGGLIMKTNLKIAFLSIAIIAGIQTNAQDDFYPSRPKNNSNNVQPVEDKINVNQYSTATDYYYEQKQADKQRVYNEQMGITDSTTYYTDENGDTRITNNYYNGNNYDYNNEYYDYEYSSRIKRFHRPYGRYSYYDDCYTNYYWYDYNPYNYGVSVYSSYGWWYPRPWGWNIGWSWGGWYTSWGWNTVGWGWSPWGWYGSSYWSGYNHGYWDGYYAGNYYNSYDRNSYYYGHRSSVRSSSGGYGRASRPNNSGIVASKNPVSMVPKTFGEKYESAVRNNTNSINHSPRTINGNVPTNGSKNPTSIGNNPNGVYGNGNTNGVKNPNTISNAPSYNNGSSSPRSTNSTISSPVYPRTTTDQIQVNPGAQNNSMPEQNYGGSKPRTGGNLGGGNPVFPQPKRNDDVSPSNPPSYSSPRPRSNGGYNDGRSPRNYSQPSNQPSYNKPHQPSYSQPNNSYSRPSGGSFNRGGGGSPSHGGGGGGGSRRPR
ncbi:MAG: hypothetical protein IT232_05840 [Flavobacteriales bacterium]|nr:hypothetical protein [Flavobacteriales bacterium]